jgi:hypothetical protein
LTPYDCKDRKYFDSGDYALSKAGVTSTATVGTAIPNPEKYAPLFCSVTCFLNCNGFHSIPHASGVGNGHGAGHQSLSISPTNSTSPVNRESSLSHFEKPPNGDDDVQATTTSDTATNTTIKAVVNETEKIV